MAEPEWVGRALDAARSLGRSAGASVALVGSYARGEARPESDVDLVVLVADPAELLSSSAWFAAFGDGVSLVRTADFGALQERRLVTADGHVIEVCVGRPSWAACDPVEPGTASVVRGGLRALHDPHGHLAELLAATGR